MDEPTGKRCVNCGEVKTPGEFNRDRSTPDGLTARCRDCRRQADRDRYAADPEGGRQATRRWRAANPEASREATRQSMRRWIAANKEAAREHDQRWYAAYRTQVFDHYGRECKCCGSCVKLVIDHVHGDGKRHREEIGHGGPAMYRWLIANGFPDGFQVLCDPCNKSKSDGDRCRLDHLGRVFL
jgi:hypothetical protein